MSRAPDATLNVTANRGDFITLPSSTFTITANAGWGSSPDHRCPHRDHITFSYRCCDSPCRCLAIR